MKKDHFQSLNEKEGKKKKKKKKKKKNEHQWRWSADRGVDNNRWQQHSFDKDTVERDSAGIGASWSGGSCGHQRRREREWRQ
jgi:hypothetical protein